MRVRVTIADDAFICDFTGSSGQVPGPVNCGTTGLHSAVRAAWKAVTDPLIPANEGVFRPLQVICPPRTIFTAEKPAPVSTYWETMLYAADLVWKALAPIVPNRLTAGHFLSVCGTVVYGLHPDDGSLYLLVEPQAGGWGAGMDKDGENGLVCVGDGETYVMERSLVPDVSLVKAHRADKSGNLQFRLTARNFNPAAATAGKVCIVEVEEVVEVGEIAPDDIHLPGIYVHRIVHNPNPEKRIEKRTITEKQGA